LPIKLVKSSNVEKFRPHWLDKRRLGTSYDYSHGGGDDAASTTRPIRTVPHQTANEATSQFPTELTAQLAVLMEKFVSAAVRR
ncbi:Hypothetical protein FKW44_004698, partial [Caligus rogercresseyi]